MPQGICLQCKDSFEIEPGQPKQFPFCPYCNAVLNGPVTDAWLPVLCRQRKTAMVDDEENR